MKRKIFALMLAVIFVLAQISFVEAKGSSGGARSSGSYSGSSSSKSIGGSSSTSKSVGGYSGSSSSQSTPSRSVPGSYSGGSSSSSSSSKSALGGSGSSAGSTVKSKTETQKNSYMSEEYKKQASKQNYTTYQQKLNTEQQQAYDRSFKTDYRVNNRMDFEDAMRTRDYRVNNTFGSRPVIINMNQGYFGGYGGSFGWGSAFAGAWDMWFLMHASQLFWYHHWNDISPYRDNFEAQKFAEMEARVKALEQQGVARDPNYMEPDVDPDLQFSKEYQEKNPDKIYYTNKYSQPVTNPLVVIFFFVAIAVGLLMVIQYLSRRRNRKKDFDSRIY